jgi:peptidoglycan/xylan/chitin deacetylase (PgdA/CDA1 family)
MRIPGVKTAKAFSRWLQARWLGGAMILGYHRVAQVMYDEYGNCVSPENFAEHMAVLRKYARPINLSTLVQHLEEGTLPEKSVAVTFDDGYADNLYNAQPVLKQYEIPATVFICTGSMGKEFWWDELERLVMSSLSNPETLCLQSGEITFQWEQPTGLNAEGNLQGNLMRRNFLQTLYHFLLPLDHEERCNVMEAIRTWSVLPIEQSIETRAMNPEELLLLSKNGLVELGAHTRTHPMLPNLTLEKQMDEIFSSKSDLETLLGRSVTGFAYPNGQVTADAVRMVREAGFGYACTSPHNVVRPGCDPYQLTRFWQKNVDGESFLRSLRLWMNR